MLMIQQNDETILKSKVFIKNTIIVNLVGVLVLCAFVTLLLLAILPLGTRVERFLLISIWVTLPLFWAIGSAALLNRERKTKYTLGTQTLIVRKGSLLGSSTESMYRYDSMLSVESRQTRLGNKYNYGTIFITVPRLENAVQLKGIQNPHDYAKKIKEAVYTTSSNRSDSLVV